MLEERKKCDKTTEDMFYAKQGKWNNYTLLVHLQIILINQNSQFWLVRMLFCNLFIFNCKSKICLS